MKNCKQKKWKTWKMFFYSLFWTPCLKCWEEWKHWLKHLNWHESKIKWTQLLIKCDKCKKKFKIKTPCWFSYSWYNNPKFWSNNKIPNLYFTPL